MSKVILHLGDKVTHTTLGEGVVTVVDDEFVTIKFTTDDLTFRLPDAFENGFLNSYDAQYVEENEDEDWKEDGEKDYEEVVVEEEDFDENESPVPIHTTAESKLGFTGTLVTIILPFLFFGSFAVLSFVVYYNTDFLLFLFLGILNIAFIFYSISVFVKAWKHPLKYNTTLTDTSYNTGLSPSAKFSAIMLGMWMGRRADRRKHDSLFDNAHDSIFWHEKYRKDHYYDDEDW